MEMQNIEILKEIEKDYAISIQFLHDQTIRCYSDLAAIRNKKYQISKLIKQLQVKKNG